MGTTKADRQGDTEAAVHSLCAYREAKQDHGSYAMAAKDFVLHSLEFTYKRMADTPATSQAHHQITHILKDTIDRLKNVRE